MNRREIKTLSKKIDMLVEKKRLKSKEYLLTQLTEEQIQRIIRG